MARTKLWRNEDGAIVLEASMIFPLVLMFTFMLMFFALWMSHQSIVYYRTSVTAERAGFSWSNSASDIKTGAYPEGVYDGLYWRLSDDALIGDWFGMARGESGVTIAFHAGMATRDGPSAENKLSKSAIDIADSLTGAMHYRNRGGVFREVEVEASGGWMPMPLSRFLGRRNVEAASTAWIVEPAEFIRDWDLVRYYGAKMKRQSEGTSFKAKAAEVLRKYIGR